MAENTEESMRRRLDLVERQLRLFKIIGSAILSTCFLVVIFGATAPKVQEEIRARRFVVVGPGNKSVGEFAFGNGGTSLSLSDPDGQPRVVLAHGYDTWSGLSILNRKRASVSLGQAIGGSAALELFDGAGKLRAVVSLASDGKPELWFHDENGKAVWRNP